MFQLDAGHVLCNVDGRKCQIPFQVIPQVGRAEEKDGWLQAVLAMTVSLAEMHMGFSSETWALTQYPRAGNKHLWNSGF